MMNGNSVFMMLFGFILVAYFFLYVGGRYYLREDFQNAGAGGSSVGQIYPTPIPVMQTASPDMGAGRVLMEYTTPDPVAKGAIQKLDDYEYDLVYQNESDRSLSQALRNKLMSQRPMDWAGLPESSAQFQAGLRESFENATRTVSDTPKTFQVISGENMVPPDIKSVEMEERKVLQTYKAPTAVELSKYSAEEEPKEMIRKLYETKGLIPSVIHKEGTNVYEVVGVRKKDEKVVYEDEEAPASMNPIPHMGEASIQVPPTAYDTAAAVDPYYNTMSKTRIGKWDYQAWTPGLERMFAPTNSTQTWN
ncbi:hypothetical protein EBR66_02405 [bacterium]|nr:hypothetical protein [bacterium]